MDFDLLDKIKRISIIALVSDDDIMDRLVLKGGNAINIVYDLSQRASIDLDYSMQDDFDKDELQDIKSRIEKLLKDSFKQEGYKLFDYKFFEKPKKISKDKKDFWGSYNIEFKLIPLDQYEEKKQDIETLRRNSLVIGYNNQKKYHIEISKYEFCEGKEQVNIDGYTLFAYTPEMIVIEKLRAICQQIPDYKNIVKTITLKERARDFFDIYVLMEYFNIDINTQKNKDLLKNIFKAKKVPLEYLQKIKSTKSQHEENFHSVKDTVTSKEKIKDFNFYFEYVVKIAESVNL